MESAVALGCSELFRKRRDNIQMGLEVKWEPKKYGSGILELRLLYTIDGYQHCLLFQPDVFESLQCYRDKRFQKLEKSTDELCQAISTLGKVGINKQQEMLDNVSDCTNPFDTMDIDFFNSFTVEEIIESLNKSTYYVMLRGMATKSLVQNISSGNGHVYKFKEVDKIIRLVANGNNAGGLLASKNDLCFILHFTNPKNGPLDSHPNRILRDFIGFLND